MNREQKKIAIKVKALEKQVARILKRIDTSSSIVGDQLLEMLCDGANIERIVGYCQVVTSDELLEPTLKSLLSQFSKKMVEIDKNIEVFHSLSSVSSVPSVRKSS